MAATDWSYPGARWRKFDFHTHTPASRDTYWAEKNAALTPQEWLLKHMAAEIDCVAVTDHNSGAWLDTLKKAYEEMCQQAEQGQPPAGFRPLTIFPGVEISANGGVHVLAIFDPSATTGDIDSLLGAVGYNHTKGASDGETSKSVSEVIAEILKAGAIPIPAHADQAKGLLQVKPGTRECALSANTVKQALGVEGLLAVEWCDWTNPYPQSVEKLAQPLARVLGSDCHSFQGVNVPGSRFTWVKMAHPNLEGLRLALLDGNDVSLRRSDEGAFDPFRIPEHVIRRLEIRNAKVIGNGQPAVIELSPYFNAIVGGRGTGKSTLVHTLRRATRREEEILALPKASEPRERFVAFCTIARGRHDPGALKPDTVIHVEWQHENQLLRLNWQAEGEFTAVEEWRDGQWQPSGSQSVNAARFPVRILSQGQIATMAGDGRQALLAIIDEAAEVGPLKQALEEATNTFFVQRARLREMDGKLDMLPEIERRLQETEDKLRTLGQTNHAAILQAHARAQHQSRAVDETLKQLQGFANVLRQTAENLLLDDWLPQRLNANGTDLPAWRSEAEGLLSGVRQRLEQEASALEEGIQRLQQDQRLLDWRKRVEEDMRQYDALQAQLTAQGVADPQAFARLTRERQQLETQLKELRQLQTDREVLVKQIESQRELVRERRQAITQRRQAFLQETLTNNPHVRMQVVPFGFDAQVIERSLRELLDVTDERFANDIFRLEDGGVQSGLAFDLAHADKDETLVPLQKIKDKLLSCSPGLGGHLRKYLERKLQKPEFADRILAWFPEDDLRIEYQRDGKWYAIEEGSQGQRSAALLAFLLAFGNEPIVLDQPEDDLDNHLIYDLIVRQIRENKLRRQLIIVTHNPNVVVNGDAELVHVMAFGRGQCFVQQSGALQEKGVRDEVCRVMEGGREAFARRWKRLGKEV